MAVVVLTERSWGWSVIPVTAGGTAALESLPADLGAFIAVTDPPPESWLSVGVRWAASTITTSADATAATAPNAKPCRRSAWNGRFQAAGGREKPSPTRASSRAAHVGSGAGRTSRRSISRSGIDGLPELGHGAVQERAGVGRGDAEDGGDLGVGEAGVVLERNQLAVLGSKRGECAAHRIALRGELHRLVGRGRRRGRREPALGGALAPPQLVQ